MPGPREVGSPNTPKKRGQPEPGTRCRDCENLHSGDLNKCKVCGSTEVFPVDLVNELVELLALTSAEADFVDPIPGLSEAGEVAALLRY